MSLVKHRWYLRYKNTPNGRAARARAEKRYRQKHREEKRLKARAWRLANLEYARAKCREYKAKHRDEVRQQQREVYGQTPVGLRRRFRLLKGAPEKLVEICQNLYNLKKELKHEHV